MEQTLVSTPAVFDAARPIAINLRGPGGLKTVRVRFPTDEEWTERQRRRKVVIKQLGRGISETIVANGEEVDAALVAKLRTDPAPEIDAFEAAKVIEQLSMAEVDDVVAEGDSFRVTTRVLGGSTTHILKMPSAKDMFDYRRGFARVLDLPFGRQELTINIAPAATLYKKLVAATEGYAGDVPILHQAQAVKAAIDAMDNAFAEDREANFK
jgi:hypothetical protein